MEDDPVIECGGHGAAAEAMMLVEVEEHDARWWRLDVGWMCGWRIWDLGFGYQGDRQTIR